MKRIIGGKRYDTETATCLGEYSRGYPSDFHHFSEALYRTAKGAYFLAGDGGALSSWGEATGNGNERGPGSGLRVLTEVEARAWCETHDVAASTIEEAFPVEDA